VDPANLAAGSTVQDSQIQAEIQALVTDGAVAGPDANRVYVVYVQPNVVVSQGGANSQRNFLGYHGAFGGHTASGQPIDIHYAVIPYPGGSVGNATNSANAIDDLTSVTSHELAESMTDPNVNYKTLGWYDPARGEIGDITEQYLVRLNGYLVQEVAGQNDRPLTLNTGTGSGGTGGTGQPSLADTQVTLTASASQVYAGQSLTITLKVTSSSGSATPSGTVTLMDGNQVIGHVQLGAGGQVTVRLYTSQGSVGTHTITAKYEGSDSFKGSVSNSITLNVLQPLFNPFPIWIFYYQRHGH
jgi:hypothetical protein